MSTDLEKTHIPAYVLNPIRRAPPNSAATPRPPMPDFIKDVEAGRVKLPSIPAIVQRLIAALRDPEIDMRAITKMLRRDPVLSAKVLRLANSSVFGSSRSLASIEAAVGLIGVDALNKLIMTCGIAGELRNVVGIDLRVFWRDTLVTAVAANKLAPHTGADPQEAYLCGLLHATGHLILCRSYPEIADAMFTGFEILRGEELASVEAEAFGVDHAGASAFWVESLDFPKELVETIRTQLSPESAASSPLSRALRGGRALATALLHRADAAGALATLSPALRQKLSGDDGQPEPGFEKFYDALHEVEPNV